MPQDLLQLDFGLDATAPQRERATDAVGAALDVFMGAEADRIGFFAAKAQAGASFQDFVTLALFRFGRADALAVVSVFFAESAVPALAKWLKITAPTRLRMIFGKQMTQARYDHVTAALREAIGTSGTPADIRYVTHHTKFVVVTRGKAALVLASSANLNHNENAENYMISTEPTVCAAFAEFAERNLGGKVLRRIRCP